MATGRFLSTSIAEDDRLSRLSLLAEFVFLKTIPHLDRDGMITGKPGLLYSKVCPLREELFGETAALIDEWVEAGLVVRFVCNEGTVLFFPGFAKNNNLPHYNRERASRFPAPPGYTRTPNGLIQDEVQELIQDEVQELIQDEVPIFGTEGKGREVEDQVEVKGRDRARATESPKNIPPSLAIYQEFCKKPINQTQKDAVSSAVSDLALWRRVLTEWTLRGYNMGNVHGILDWYEHPDKMAATNGVARGGDHPPPRTGNRGLNAATEYMRKKGMLPDGSN